MGEATAMMTVHENEVAGEILPSSWENGDVAASGRVRERSDFIYVYAHLFCTDEHVVVSHHNSELL